MNKQLFYVPVKEAMDGDSKYSRAIKVPQYVPSRDKPMLDSLIDIQKYSELMGNINASNVSEEEKRFLRFAATRHIGFNYALIADYYAHATPEMQRLMEQSALVILDIDDAIANGYVKLSAKMNQLVEEEKERAKKDKLNG